MARKPKQPEADRTEVVAVVREWEPQTNDSLDTIHANVDALGKPGATATAPATPRPALATKDLAELQARVDRLTKRVKARKVTVTETVTEWVDDDGPVEVVSAARAAPWTPNATRDEPILEEAAKDATTSSGGKRKPRILGWFGPKSQKDKVDAALEERAASAATASGSGSAGPGTGTLQPQCGALTEDGMQCRNSSRDGSRYCISHKGYQPPTAKGLAQRIEGDAWDPSDSRTDRSSVRAADTKPRVRRAKDTSVAVRKAGRRPAGRSNTRSNGTRRTVARKAR